MRPMVSCRTAWFFLATLAWISPPVAWSAPPLESPQPLVSTDASALDSSQQASETALQNALQFERQKNWQAAIHAYTDALETWPSRLDFVHRRRLCETHYKLVRRYQDQSFRNVLLRLPQEKSLALYDELLERIETHYVDPVPFEPLVRRGFDNLEVALRDPEFLRTNASTTDAERVKWLRDALRARRARISTPDRRSAQNEVLAACELATKALHLGASAVILEFTYGACDSLDDYTSYLTPDKLEDLYAMIDGNFVGLGIELKLDTEGLRLVGVIRGGPASEAGLKVGDQITRVGEVAVRGLSLDEAAGRLQGAEGTPIDLQILRSDGSTKSFRIVRRHVEVESVAQAKIVDQASGIGYLQLVGFQKNSTEELDKAIAALRRQGMRSLVIDLRGNPGGLLNVAVEMAERFIDRGVIVSTRGRAPGQSQVYKANSKALWTMPLTVLIDHDSASASEILAGALKDHNRAVIVGQRSYGKGSVQSIFALRTAPAGLKLTTAKFYSPKDRAYSEQGVDPDIKVHVTAKPAADSVASSGTDTPQAEEIPGDPLHDTALVKAMEQAKRRLNAAR
ncbi:S41 family peptidase [Singulisphaera acidiphila]|uniref:C-terminal processing peptidase n=1 Tax=Singulisphaera acidiphila (strain ATCC BAA-1392 / DSM 18658 / VKM B-2454 / MOB10) TaxID=886293 RepID=L0DKB7_SINAD|nr:S41 family peptidase [Singulisphaera acidiphila]AGA29096.1 C-terminal processing peptidase [Singulisphaera acidiphila DSM 18658]